MLTQKKFHRRDAETRRIVWPIRLQPQSPKILRFIKKSWFLVALRLCVSAVVVFSVACGSKPTDPRNVIPGDALVYLETNDLGKTLATITDNPKFQQLAKTKPDLSILNGVKLSVAMTGFEATEQPVTEENSVIGWQPKLVAVAETNAWGWQTKSFVENQLGEFVNEVYDGAVELEITTRKDGEFYVWTSPEGRKAYALQQGSLVFFGNDESAIERCQAVKRGEAESIAKNPKITEGERIAFGYVSPDGVGQIANIAGIWLAMGASEEDEVKSFIARVMPEILRNTIREVTWTAAASEGIIEDKFIISLDDESSRVFNETIVPAQSGGTGLESFIPADAAVSTRYRLRDPQIAWRSILLTSQKMTDETSGALIAAFSSSIFESYGVEEPEMFLSSIGAELLTVRIGADSDDVAVIAAAKDAALLRRAIAKEIKLGAAPEKQFGADVWKSEDGEQAIAFSGETIVLGSTDVVLKCLEAKNGPAPANVVRELTSSDAVAVTVASEETAPGKLISILSEPKDDAGRVVLSYKTETRFNRNGIERRTTSDFGLIGSMIERLVPE
jgi:hypothetical protein